MEDVDLAFSIGIAVVVIIIALFVWPGFARIHPRSLAGYWSSQKTGDMYEIRPTAGKEFVLLTSSGAIPGNVRGIYKIQIATSKNAGRVGLGWRQILWDDDTWTLQGIR